MREVIDDQLIDIQIIKYKLKIKSDAPEGSLEANDVPATIKGFEVRNSFIYMKVYWKNRENGQILKPTFVTSQSLRTKYPHMVIDFYKTECLKVSTRNKRLKKPLIKF